MLYGTRPWQMPWGLVGLAEVGSTPTALTTTVADVSGLSISFTAVAGRRYRAELFVPLLLSPSDADVEYYIYLTDSSNTVLQESRPNPPPITSKNTSFTVLSRILTPGAGSLTYKIRGKTQTGTVSLYANSGSGVYMQFSIADVGPA